MPLAFEVNRGQTDAKVKYLTRAQNFTVFMMPGETVLRGRNADVLRLKLQNANQAPKVVGEDLQRQVTNYYIGNDRSKWQVGVPNFGQVRYRDVYSGIDMVYHSDQRQLEYDFVVKPGADPKQIRVEFEGATKIAITAAGELELKSPAGNSVNHKPVVYQTIDGHRKPVAGEFALANNVVGFKIGEYDRTQPLVIDPTLQVLSFFGGVLNDEAAGIAVSAVQPNLTTAGIVFVGRSESPSLPGPPGSPNKPAGSLNWDSFAVGLNAGTPGVSASGGTTILWTTYFGGSGDDAARGVAMDNQGNVYVAGYTSSTNFPAGVASNYDAYIVKIAAAGGAITASTLYGGPLVDKATSIALDYSTFSNLGATAFAIVNPATDPRVIPNVVIGGVTNGSIGTPGSPSATTATPDGNQTSFNNCTALSSQPGGTADCGNTDGFVAIFSPTLGLLHATYIGGGGNDQVNGVAVDVWGNIYATGLATPNVSPNFPVSRGIAETNSPTPSGAASVTPSGAAARGGCNTNSTNTGFGCWDAAGAPQGAAAAFVAKWACTTGSPAIGVPSPPFGVTTLAPNWPGSQFPICGGGNNLKTLSNSALFGGNAAGGNAFINPQQTVQGLQGITEAGFGIAVDQNGWGQEGVAGVNGAPGAVPVFTNATGFPDIVPLSESTTGICNSGAQGYNGFNAFVCAVSLTNSPTTGGFEPGLSGPHVYVVGNTLDRAFATNLVTRASCEVPPEVSSTAVPALCPIPFVFGGAVSGATVPGISSPGVITPGQPLCDPMGIGNCPTGDPTGDLRIKTWGTSGAPSGQSQGWLVSFQFPAVTQDVVTPPLSTQTTVTTLNPPTIPNYIVLQPATCPPATLTGQTVPCQEGGLNTTAGIFGTATAGPPAFMSCTNGGNGVICPNAFIGSWNAVTVDTDQQVYVIGQIGMSGQASGMFGTGPPNRLALELERIGPYANTPGGNGLEPNFCAGPAAPCAFPLEEFPNTDFFGTDFVIDSTVIPTVGQAPLNSQYGQILPGAPPSPNPSQPGGLGNGIAVNPLREAFFVGTSAELTPEVPPVEATAQLGAGQVVSVTVLAIAATQPYTSLPTCVFTGGGGQNATCSLAAGGFTLVGGQLTPPGQAPGQGYPFVCSACVTAGGDPFSYVTPPTVTLSPAVSSNQITAFLTANPINPISVGTSGVSPFQGFLAGSPQGGGNAGESCLPAQYVNGICASSGPEDVLFGAVQFFDAIATPTTAISFTATVNSFPSVTAFNGSTGANAKAIMSYQNWEGQILNVPPGCIVTPVVPLLPGYPVGANGTTAAFTVTPVNGTPNSFLVQVNTAPVTPGSTQATGVVTVPGVVTSIVTFTKSGNCTGLGVPNPGNGQTLLDSWDPLTLTLTVSAPMNLAPESTFNITSRLGSGVVDQYCSGQNPSLCWAGNPPGTGQQLAANQIVSTAVDVSTASSNGPINFTAQIVPGQNWVGAVTGAVTVPIPTDIIYAAGSPGTPTRVNVNVNTQVLAELPQGVYTAWIMFTASPETPVFPTSGSTACGPATVPVASGTTSPACVPVIITITPNQVAQTPVPLVFLSQTTTPEQTSVEISNPTSTTYTFVAGYVPTPTFGTSLPAANVSFAGTSTTCPSSVGVTASGTIAPGGLCSLPVQVTPVGLTTGVYTGMILISNNGQASGATPQTTVPLIVYVGPHAGEDTPSGNGLGLMLPVNLPPIGTGALPGAAPGTPGSYPLTLSVPSGVGPNGINQIPNPTLIQVTGLNNTSVTSFSLATPTVSSTLFGVSFTNVGFGFGIPPGSTTPAGGPSTCSPTFAQLASLPGTPVGPPCVWSLWVDATALNSTNTQPNAAACGLSSQTGLPNLGETGTITFAAAGGSFPMASLVVPLTVCVTDFPSLILGMPNTYPNPTFGPNTGTGFGTCNGGNPDCLLAQPSNLIPGFPISITDMVLAASNGGTLGSTSPAITLLASAGNSQEVCKVLDIRTNGGVLNNVTIAPIGVQWLTVNEAPAVFLGPPVGAPNSIPANSTNPVGADFILGDGVYGMGDASNPSGLLALPLPGTPPFSAGPGEVTPAIQTFQICVNTDPVGNVAGIFSSIVSINGGGVGPITIPVNMDIASATGSTTGTGGAIYSELGVLRPTTANANTSMAFYLDNSGTNAWTATDKVRLFGVSGIPGVTINDAPVAGDWDGTGVVRFGVFHCPASAAIGPCIWYIDMNNNGQWDGVFGGDAAWPNFGLAGDTPVVGDWTGDGKSKIGVMRCSAAPSINPCVFYLDMGNKHTFDPATVGILFLGAPGAMPAIGNWVAAPTSPAVQIGVVQCPTVGGSCTWTVDSTGKTGGANPTPIDVRPSATGPLGIGNSFTAAGGFATGDVAVMGNWNGNGKLRMGIFRSSTGQWFVDTNGNGVYDVGVDQVFSFGLPPAANPGGVPDMPIVGFWTMP